MATDVVPIIDEPTPAPRPPRKPARLLRVRYTLRGAWTAVVFACLSLRYRHAAACCREVAATLTDSLHRSAQAARARIVAYLCVQALLLAGRQPQYAGQPLTWEGAGAMARMLDALAAREALPS